MENIYLDNVSSEEFVKLTNKARLANKGHWYSATGLVNNKEIRLKAFGTWLQVLDVNAIRHGVSTNVSVAGFKEILSRATA